MPTNIVTPLASVITNVQFDHQQWLGDTLAQIAREKAGIIKPRVPSSHAADSPEALQVITETARQNVAPLRRVTRADTERLPLGSIQLPLLGDHQRLNAALAIATVQTLGESIPVTDEAIRQGLETVQWAGRFHLIKRSDPPNHSSRWGAQSSRGRDSKGHSGQTFSEHTPVVVLGLLRDKDCLAICRVLAPLAERFCLAPVESERTASPHGLAELCRKENVTSKVAAYDSLAEALRQTEDCPLVVVTGSLHFVGQAMEYLGLFEQGSLRSAVSMNGREPRVR